MQSRPICNSVESPSRSLCELETSNGNQRLSPLLERPRRLCLSSLLTDRQVPSEGETRTEHNCASGSSMVEPTDAPGVDGGVSTAFARPEGILRDPMNRVHPLVCLNRLVLAAWRVPGNNTQQQEFQRKLLNYRWLVGAMEQTWLTNLDGSVGMAGVRDGKLIPFLTECSHS